MTRQKRTRPQYSKLLETLGNQPFPQLIDGIEDDLDQLIGKYSHALAERHQAWPSLCRTYLITRLIGELERLQYAAARTTLDAAVQVPDLVEDGVVDEPERPVPARVDVCNALGIRRQNLDRWMKSRGDRFEDVNDKADEDAYRQWVDGLKDTDFDTADPMFGDEGDTPIYKDSIYKDGE